MENTIEITNSLISVHLGEIDTLPQSVSHDFPYKIINVVALGILVVKDKQPINFEELEKRIPVKRLNRFPCVMFKLEPISAILFRNGKMIITGIKNREDIPIVKNNIESYLQKSGLDIASFDIQIQNLVAMTSLNRTINLEMACLSLSNCIYEPEQFPAAIIKPITGGAFLLFSNSKIICLGMRNLEILEKNLRELIQSIFENELFIEIKPFNFDDTDIDLF